MSIPVVHIKFEKDISNFSLNMVYTKEEFEKNYIILNSNSESVEGKKKANLYFESLKNSEHLLELCKDILLNNSNQNSEILLFSSILIRQYINKTINKLINNENDFEKVKNILLTLFQKFNQLSLINFKIINFICSSITIIILGGMISFWKDGFDNVIDISYSNENNLLYSSLILAAIKDEINSLKLNDNLIQKIKIELKNKNEKMNYFISQVFNKVQNENNPNSILYETLINLSSCIHLFNINILKINNLCSNLISSLALIQKDELRNNISEILSDAFSISYSSNLGDREIINYYLYKTFDQFIDVKINTDEFSSILSILNMINTLYLNYKDKNVIDILNNEKDIEFIFSAANIFSSLSSNYNYLFFMKGEKYNNICLTCRILLLYFISFPYYKISQLMFESISSIKFFFERGFCLEENDKNEFENFILSINKSIFNNSKLTKREIDDNTLLEYLNEKLKYGTSNFHFEEILNRNINDEEKILYRKNISSVYDDILYIYKKNFKLENYLFNLGNEMNDSIKSNNLVNIECVILNISSILVHFRDLNSEYNFILNFLNYIYNNSSIIFASQRILISYLNLINLISFLIWRSNEVFINTINFLININNFTGNVEINNTEKIIIYLISKNINWYKLNIDNILKINSQQDFTNIQNIFLSLNQCYSKNFGKLSSELINNLIESMIDIALINIKMNNIQDSNNIMLNISQNILSKSYELIKKITSDPNPNYDTMKEEIQKIYEINISIILNLGNYNKELLYLLMNQKSINEEQNYFLFIYSFSLKSIQILSNEYKVMETIFRFYTLLVHYLSKYSSYLFNAINDIIFNLYNKCQTYPFIIDCMNELYSTVLNGNDQEKINLITEKSFIVLSQIFQAIKNNKDEQIDIIIKFSNLFQIFISGIPDFESLIKKNFDNKMLFNNILVYLISIYKTYHESNLIISLIKLFNLLFNDLNIDFEISKYYLDDIIIGTIDHFDYQNDILYNGYTHLFNYIYNANKELFKDAFRKKFNDEIVNIIDNFLNKHHFNYSNKKSLDDTYVNNIKLINNFIKDLIEIYNYKEKEYNFMQKYEKIKDVNIKNQKFTLLSIYN